MDQMSLDCFGATECGRFRSSNQDEVIVAPERGFFGIADGMGGKPHGEVASKLGLWTIAEFCSGMPDEAKLCHAFFAANEALRQRSRELMPHGGFMGCAATVLWFDRNSGKGLVGHVGDTRGYHYGVDQGKSVLKRLTVDHNLTTSPIEAERNLPEAHCTLTRNIGLDEHKEDEKKEWVDIVPLELQVGESFLLTSDGLTSFVDDATIGAILFYSDRSSPEEVVGTLIHAAIRTQKHVAGGDNVGLVFGKRNA